MSGAATLLALCVEGKLKLLRGFPPTSRARARRGGPNGFIPFAQLIEDAQFFRDRAGSELAAERTLTIEYPGE